MNSNDNPKIKKYLALAGSITSAVSAVNAQVVYTDINPDFLLTGNFNTYNLDLNNDSIFDFTFTNIDYYYNSTSTSGSNVNTSVANVVGAAIGNNVLNNSWMVGPSTSFYEPLSLNQGDLIGASASFTSYYISSSSSLGAPIAANLNYQYFLNGVLTSSSNYFFGDFVIDQEGIIGVKFNISGDIHYGWVRVEVSSDKLLSIKDYAYESTPNSPIIAGDNGAGLVSVSNELMDVGIHQVDNNLRIINDSGINKLNLELVNISGQSVMNTQVKNAVDNFDLSELAGGIYFVKVYSSTQSTLKKIYVR